MSGSGRLLSVVFVFCVILVSFGPATSVSALTIDHRLVQRQQIAEGIYILHYELHLGGNTLPVRKLTLSLDDPHVQIRAIHPPEGFNNKQTVKEMATEQDAVAAVNADFFHLARPAAPFGLHVEAGDILSSPADNAWMGFGVDADRTAHILNWQFRGEVISGAGHRHRLHGFNQTYQAGTDAIYLYDRTWGTEVSSVFFDGPVLKVTVRDGIVTQMLRNAEPAGVPSDGYVVVAEGMGADFLLRHARLGSSMDFTLGIEPDLQLDAAVGGQALLVEDGRPVDPSRFSSPGSTRASRTAVGVADEQVFFVTIDATPVAAGVTLEELSLFMSQMGAERALNLDGGGSTTMVARRLGEFQLELVSRPRHGVERSVPNAIGIFNLAPKTGVSRLYLQGQEGLLVGTEATYRVSGHDRHYHPTVIHPQELMWDVSDPAAAEVTDGRLRGKEPGKITLRVTYQGVTEEMTVRVFGGEDIAHFSITPGQIRLLPGQSVSLTSEVTTVCGLSLATGPETVRWEADLGRVQGSTYHALEEGFGTLRAEIDGRVSEVPIRIGGSRQPFFTFREWQTTAFRSHPADLPGRFEVQTDPAYVYAGERSGRLEYDFSTEVDGIMIAYGQLGSGQISMGTNNLGISAHVYGDGSGYWLRAEIFDGGGTRRYVDLAREVNWIGWQRVQGQIDPSWPQPLVLSSIYLVQEPQHRAAGLPKTGAIYIDHIEMIKGLTEQDQERAGVPELIMWVNSTEYEIRGQPATMDAAPFIENGRTFVPLRYMGEAFGAEVDWTSHPQTGLTDRVLLETEERLIILGIGEFTMIVVNKATDTTNVIEMDVAPSIVDGRAYLPFRAIVEDGFAGQVGFSQDPDTGRVESVWVER